MKKLKIGTISAEPGTKSFGFFNIAHNPSGSMLTFPIYIVNGLGEGPTLLAVAGTHGDETEPVVALAQLAQKLNPKRIKGIFIGIPVLNVSAFETRGRGSPYWIDPVDLNLCLLSPDPNKVTGVTTKIAYTFYEEVLKKADYCIALHTAVKHMFSIERVILQKDSPQCVDFAKALGGKWDILQVPQPHQMNALTEGCSRLGIPCMITERGGGGCRIPDIFKQSIDSTVTGLVNVLKNLNMLEGEPERPLNSWTVIEREDPKSSEGGLSIPEPTLLDYMWSKKKVSKGTPLMKIINVFGEELETVRAPCDGIVVGLKTDPTLEPGGRTLQFGKIMKIIER